MVPTTGGDGIGLTVRAKVAVAETHILPEGLSVVTVINTILPASVVAGV
jgi:hypothetical protein